MFLATNSDYKYTNVSDHMCHSAPPLILPSSSAPLPRQPVMSYMFDLPQTGGRSWKSYFDYIFVDAQKPRFFQEGTTLREVDEATGSLKLGQIRSGTGLERGKVYAGGESGCPSRVSGGSHTPYATHRLLRPAVPVRLHQWQGGWGSCCLLCLLWSATDSYSTPCLQNILFVGDHIFGDIIKSKKQQAMR